MKTTNWIHLFYRSLNYRIDKIHIESIAQLLNARCNLIKMYFFFASIYIKNGMEFYIVKLNIFWANANSLHTPFMDKHSRRFNHFTVYYIFVICTNLLNKIIKQNIYFKNTKIKAHTIKGAIQFIQLKIQNAEWLKAKYSLLKVLFNRSNETKTFIWLKLKHVLLQMRRYWNWRENKNHLTYTTSG